MSGRRVEAWKAMNPISSRQTAGCTLAYNSGPLTNNAALTVTHVTDEYVSPSASPSSVAHPLESVSPSASPSSASAADPDYKPSRSPEDSPVRVAHGPIGLQHQGQPPRGMAMAANLRNGAPGPTARKCRVLGHAS